MDLYTGETFTDPGDLDIDHYIPLAEAHRSGADTWTAQRREDFANDLTHPDALIAVSASANRSKSDRDPAGWLPPDTGYQCAYVDTWVAIKGIWDLTIDSEERAAIDEVLGGCADTPVTEPVTQSDTFMVFPQVASGAFSDGGFYRTTLSLVGQSDNDATCDLTLYGLEVDFGSGMGSEFPLTVPGGSFISIQTTGAGTIDSGYATVTCDREVSGQLSYGAYTVAGRKIAEATVFPTEVETSSYDILVDGRDGARLGLPIANNTDASRMYNLSLRDSSGVLISTGQVTVPPRSNVARFLNELVSPEPVSGSVYLLEVRSSDSSNFSMVGLRYTGLVFSSVPAVKMQ